MNDHMRPQRKIDPSKGARLGDNTPNDADRIEIGPTRLAFGEWEAAGLELPDLQAMRRFRWERLTAHIVTRDYGGLLMFDPLNIRYATDSTNMQLWNAHNPFRALLVCADGYMAIWDYKIAPFLTEYNPLVQERRSGADFFYFGKGDKTRDAAERFAGENGLETAGPEWFATERRKKSLERMKAEELSALDVDLKFGTVGAVALDQDGNLAAGTSTGGMTGKRWGRIGDAPVIGAGTYADNRSCAVSATGWVTTPPPCKTRSPTSRWRSSASRPRRARPRPTDLTSPTQWSENRPCGACRT